MGADGVEEHLDDAFIGRAPRGGIRILYVGATR